jgi:broad specificity phosphatase PhoE
MPRPPFSASALLALALLLLAAPLTPAFALDEKAAAPLKAGGHVILMRHEKTTSGVGDPPGFQLTDCSTQRNLSDAGREDARRFGEDLRKNGIAIDRILSSPWCRCIDTARLAFPEREPEPDPSLSSFVEIRGTDDRNDALEKMRATIASWKGSGNLLMVSHGVTITALAGGSLPQGGLLVLKPKPGGFDIVATDRR